ncbi:hypothetical protein PAXRUDRAFT_172605 [Paxillus rubicundulus Ve08.2h10]|uniref:Uncharacterized protein n=1 Tax=Paxillus rubicundulus Ve08.2h10 TaxID=930991 RepID=A0A0D0BW19_9AGAM|nr:hypothetical protein PAXRUDRAFT_172605 [Paxillus rubicundulus Ve08.2h10]
MGKYDYICKLTGSKNYPQWHQQITLALKGKGLWQHCSKGTDISDYEEYSIAKPTISNIFHPTPDEIKEIREWIKDNTKAKEIICR